MFTHMVGVSKDKTSELSENTNLLYYASFVLNTQNGHLCTGRTTYSHIPVIRQFMERVV